MVWFHKFNNLLKALYLVFQAVFVFSIFMMLILGIFFHSKWILYFLLTFFVSGFFALGVREFYSYRNNSSIDEDIKI